MVGKIAANTAEKIASWREEEDALNRRMDIIGQNGNTGEHYEKPH